MIDFHAHLDLFPNPVAVADECQQRGIGTLSVTTTPSAWPGTSRLAQGRSVVRTALGLHPQLAKERRRELPLFDRYISETDFIGEVGLDGSPEFKAAWADQTHVFDHVLRSCRDAGGKVLSVHSRRATRVVLEVLERNVGAGSIVMHWFSGTQSELIRAIELNCWFSVGPAMLSGLRGRSLASRMPADRVLLETDSPFTQSAGRVLHPWDVELALAELASIWSIGPEEARLRVEANEMSLLQGAGAVRQRRLERSEDRPGFDV